MVNVDYKNRPMFLGGEVDIARFDVLTYPMIDKFTEQELGFFWRPQEIQDIIKDKNDFAGLTEHEKHIFSSNLLRQILLDSLQGREPAAILGPIASCPEIENWITAWTFSESIHSRSYTHIIRNVYPSPDKVFDKIPQVKEILDCAVDISRYYDELDQYNKLTEIFGYGVAHVPDRREHDDPEDIQGLTKFLDLYGHKKALYKCLMSVNILEGVRFYVSFACSWAFGERRVMEGNAKIIKLIARDENLHLASTQYMLRELRRKDADFEKIARETETECVKMFQDAIDQEKDWAKYLFKDGSMVGLTEPILCQYVDFIAKQRMKAVDLPNDHLTITQNPLPWTLKWIGGKEMQPAPQEVSISSYRVGGVKSDLTADGMKGFKL